MLQRILNACHEYRYGRTIVGKTLRLKKYRIQNKHYCQPVDCTTLMEYHNYVYCDDIQMFRQYL